MNDPWIASHSPIDPARLHALGYINFQWNKVELAFRILYAAFVTGPFEAGWTESYDQRISDVSEKIRKSVVASFHSEDLKIAALHCLDLIDINRKNRNQLTHFLPSSESDGVIIRNNKNADFSSIFAAPSVPSDLISLRQLAEEIDAAMAYIIGIINVVGTRSRSPLQEPPQPLPDKPPLPKMLWTVPRPPSRGRQPRHIPPSPE